MCTTQVCHYGSRGATFSRTYGRSRKSLSVRSSVLPVLRKKPVLPRIYAGTSLCCARDCSCCEKYSGSCSSKKLKNSR